MKNTGSLKVTTPTDRRSCSPGCSTPSRLGRVHQAGAAQRWFGLRDWSLVVCEVDLKVGAAFGLCLPRP